MHPLKSYLKQAGLTETEFASSVGTTASYLSQIICAKRWPSRALADEIEKATHGEVKAGELLTWKPAAA